LKVTKEKVENCQVFLTIEMDSDEMEASMQDSYHHLAQKANIPGFRKGKAPRAVVERHLGRDRLIEEAIEHMMPKAYQDALKEQEIDPFGQPEVEVTQTEPLIFKAVVPLAPKVELGDYLSIRISPEEVDINDERINEVLEEIRHQHATWEPVERPLEYSDMATMDIKGEVEEKPYVQKIGAQIQILPDLVSPAPGFSDQVVSMKKDEEKEFDITFPEDYPNKEVAGKPAHFHVKLHEMKKEILPELNDEFAAQVSSDFKTVADLRQEVEKTLSMREEERTRMEFEEKIINTAIEQSTVEYPPVLVSMEVNRILNEQARQLQMSGHAMEDYLRTINRSVEDLQEEMRPVATRNVTASLVLGKIAEAEKIEVSEEDINNGIDNMTRSAGEEKQEELRKMLDTPQTRDSLRLSLKTRKTIERLAEIAKNVVDSDKETKEEEKNEQPAIEQSTDE